MKRIALAVGLALAAGSMPVLAQDAVQDPTTPAVPTDPATPANPERPMTPADPVRPMAPTDPSIPIMPEQAAGTVRTPSEIQGEGRYPSSDGNPAEPRVVDHSADTLVVEPPHSTITVMAPSPTP